MRVLYINGVADFGSTGKIVKELSTGVVEKGGETLTLYGRNEHKTSINNYFIGSSRMYGHIFKSMVLGKHGLGSKKETYEAIRQIEKFNPDIVHLHNIHGYYLNYPILFEYLSKTNAFKVVWTLHDCWAFSGSSAYFSYHGCKEWDEGCVVCNNTKDYPKVIGKVDQRQNFKLKKEAFTSLESMMIVTPSNWLSDLTRSTFLNKYPIKTIYNGINLEIFKPYPKTKSSKLKLLGVANIWEARKGLEDFIKLAQHYGDKLEITLVGIDSKLAKTIPSSVKVVERTDSQESLAKMYSESDIYLNLSVEETMGMTTIEAIACGTPVIVYDQTAVPEIVVPSVGKVVEAGNIDNLIKTIDGFDLQSYTENTLVEFAAEFSEKNMIEHYLELYKSVLNQ